MFLVAEKKKQELAATTKAKVQMNAFSETEAATKANLVELM
jgi:hypothetical protein